MKESTELRTEPILLVGAYERDNFGDLLFAMVTELLLDGRPVVHGSPFHGQADDILGAVVEPYGPFLDKTRPAAIWCVGGETGGANAESAFRLTHTEAFSPAAMQRAAGGYVVESPYLPRPSAYCRGVTAPLVINSVGLSGIRTLRAESQRLALATLREADVISVRDSVSHEMLEGLGIPSLLAPDIVQSIHLIKPRESFGPSESVAVVQCSVSILSVIGIHQFARWLGESPALSGLRIELLAAGLAPGHDSYELYGELVESVGSQFPGRDIRVLEERDPWLLVQRIATAALWVGTSLHGRIVSSAYAVPRVSIENAKTAQYASDWDPKMPHGVRWDDVESATVEALSLATRDREAGPGRELAHAAVKNFEQLLGVLESVSVTTDLGRLEARVAQGQALYRTLHAEHVELTRRTEFFIRLRHLLQNPRGVLRRRFERIRRRPAR